jgi:hypothetical protein
VGQNKPPKWAKPSCQTQLDHQVEGFIGEGVRHAGLPLHAFHEVSNQDPDVRLTIPERRNPQKTQFRQPFRIPR